MTSESIKLLLTGDVMTGRGIDQILPHPCDPVLYEDYVKSAQDYVTLAENAHGPIPRRVPFEYVWGDALGELESRNLDFRLINLETAIIADGMPEPKGINYRMHPGNIGVLTAARIDACVLANNHMLDWGVSGLGETLETLNRAGVAAIGAGRDQREAAAPLVRPLPGGRRIIVLAYGSTDSGVPQHWAAREGDPGINVLSDYSTPAAAAIADAVGAIKRPGDVVIVSIHWGSNWGYQIGDVHRRFAHTLIESAMVDVVHGHSSHHVRACEVWRGKLIMYGCGDLINDYEGIGTHEAYRADLGLMYFPEIDVRNGELKSLEMAPFRIRAFRLERAPADDVAWLADTLSREGRHVGTGAEVTSAGRLRLIWGKRHVFL